MRHLAEINHLDEKNIQAALHPSCVEDQSPVPEGFRRAAVLLPLLRMDHSWHLLLTHRSHMVGEHKGQVAFPGGGADPEDRDSICTALREANEEIGLLPEDVNILGCMSPLKTITNYFVTPVVGVIPWPYELDLSPFEVARAFTIPLSWLVDPQNWTEKPFITKGKTDEHVIYYDLFEGELLWGISARITLNFLAALGF